MSDLLVISGNLTWPNKNQPPLCLQVRNPARLFIHPFLLFVKEQRSVIFVLKILPLHIEMCAETDFKKLFILHFF